MRTVGRSPAMTPRAVGDRVDIIDNDGRTRRGTVVGMGPVLVSVRLDAGATRRRHAVEVFEPNAFPPACPHCGAILEAVR